jgi:uncharacterized coiled-coil protein SlyX
MMLAKHYLLRFSESFPELQYGLDELYNHSYALEERRAPGYRHLLVAAKDDTANWLEAVHTAIEPTVCRDDTIRPDLWHGLATQTLWLIQVGLDDRREAFHVDQLRHHIEALQHSVAEQRQHITNLDRIIAEQRQHITNLDRIIADQQVHIHNLSHYIEQLQDTVSDLHGHIRERDKYAYWGDVLVKTD